MNRSKFYAQIHYPPHGAKTTLGGNVLFISLCTVSPCGASDRTVVELPRVSRGEAKSVDEM